MKVKFKHMMNTVELVTIFVSCGVFLSVYFVYEILAKNLTGYYWQNMCIGGFLMLTLLAINRVYPWFEYGGEEPEPSDDVTERPAPGGAAAAGS